MIKEAILAMAFIYGLAIVAIWTVDQIYFQPKFNQLEEMINGN